MRQTMTKRLSAARPRGTVKARARTDLILSLLLAAAVVAVGMRTDAFHALFRVAARNQAWELDEWFGGFVVLTVTLAVFTVRRYVDLSRAVKRQEAVTAALLASENRFTAAFRNSPHAQLVVSLRDSMVLEANDAFVELTQADPASLIRRMLPALGVWAAPDFVASLPRLIRRIGSLQNVETAVRTAGGETREVLLSAGLIEMSGTICILMGFNDISDRKAAERRLAHQAVHDPLTGLPNRALFYDRVAVAMARGERSGIAPAVLFLDLDGFKWINDSFGHPVGDELLLQVAERLKDCLRESDTCARLGGDEFAILIEDGAQDRDVARVAERILQAVSRRFVLTGTDAATTVSIGIARAEPGMDADAVLRSADLAMYMAKSTGKGRFAMYEPAMHRAAVARTQLESDMRGALERGELVLHYQPIASFEPKEILAFEALVRWQHPTRGLLEPHDFIAIAEENGFILEMGRWVLRTACAQCAAWQRQIPRRHPVSVSVNVSGRQIASPALVDEVAQALADSGLRPESLILEITETVLMLNDGAAERLRELKELGVLLAIDDFGTGYSSLAYLQRLPVDVLKVDSSFTESLGPTPSESPVSSALFALGQTLELQTVAEGIETEEQWARLEAMGCVLGQGYLIARPVPAAEAAALLRGESPADPSTPALQLPVTSIYRVRVNDPPAAMVA
jgi:diguanylate cyclase (GGDEF)-like protein/PAS domain S-box-containing protein